MQGSKTVPFYLREVEFLGIGLEFSLEYLCFELVFTALAEPLLKRDGVQYRRGDGNKQQA